jgi:hypothetical protein
VPQYHDKSGAEMFDRIFDAAEHKGVGYVSGNPNYEELTECLVEDDLRWNPGIGA